VPGDTTIGTHTSTERHEVVPRIDNIRRRYRLFFEWFGELGQFAVRVVEAAIRRPYELPELIRQMDEIGSKSAFLVMLAGAAMGVVISLETRSSLVRFGAESSLPAVIIISIITETGPIVTGLVVSGRVGAGIGAALGSMKVTEQIDAMEASGINPHGYLAATRILACTLMLPLLTLAADFSGVIMGWIATTLSQPMSFALFIHSGLQRITFHDYLPPTIKTSVFGLIIGLVSSFQGMRVSGGTEGVGRAATSSVVLSSLLIILADVVLVRFILEFFP
jgi:phospholipid/cholesterol/gamma-HCH transport system permease protein